MRWLIGWYFWLDDQRRNGRTGCSKMNRGRASNGSDDHQAPAATATYVRQSPTVGASIVHGSGHSL